MASAFDQINFIPKLFGLIVQQHVQFWIIQAFDDISLGNLAAMLGAEQVNFIFIQMINPLKPLAHANWPRYRRTFDVQDILDFIH